MDGPWSDYAAAGAGPWQDYAPTPAPPAPKPAPRVEPRGLGSQDPRARLATYVGGKVVGATKGAWDKLAGDVKDDYAKSTSRNAFADDPLGIKSLGRSARNATDVAGLVLSPVAGVVDAVVVEPAAKLLDKIPGDRYSDGKVGVDRNGLHYSPPQKLTPEQSHAQSKGMVNTALMAVPAGRAGAISAPAAVTARTAAAPNAFAEHVAKFERSNVTPSVAAASGKGAAAITNTVAENPIAGAAVRTRLKRNVGEVQAQADQIGGAYGANRGPQIAGEDVKAGVQRFASNRDAIAMGGQPAQASSFSAKAGALYDDAFNPILSAEDRAVTRFETAQGRAAEAAKRQKMAQDVEGARQAVVGLDKLPNPAKPVVRVQAQSAPAPVIATNATRTTLQGISERVNAPELRALITDKRVPSILDSLQSDGGWVRFGDLRALRTWVREAQTNDQLRQGISQASLKQLEGALTQDIYANAEKLAGPEAVAKLKRADQFYAAGSQRIERALQPFADAASGESAYHRIRQAAGSGSTADAQKLLSLKRSLSPAEWGDVAATTIKEMGRPTKGAPGAVDPDGFSLSSFVTNYAAMSPRGRQILFGSIGGGGAKATNLATELDNLVSVADDLKNVERGANASKTAVGGQTIATIAGIANPHTTIPTLGALGSMGLTGEVMTNPLAVRWLANLARAGKAGPAATSSAMGRLKAAAKDNPVLTSLYAASQAALEADRRQAEGRGHSAPARPAS